MDVESSGPHRYYGPPFEIGCIYTEGQSIYLAVEDGLLMRCVGGVARTIAPESASVYYQVRGYVPFDCICAVWRASSEMVDACVAPYLTPRREGGSYA